MSRSSHRTLWVALAATAAVLVSLLLLAAQRPAPQAAAGADARALRAVQGDPRAYARGDLVGLDPAYDAAGGRASEADLLGLYALEGSSRVVLRADVAAAGFPAAARRPLDHAGVQLVFLLDEAPGGSSGLPGLADISAAAPISWERCIVVERSPVGGFSTTVLRPATAKPGGPGWITTTSSELLAPARLAERYDMIELALDRSTAKAGNPGSARYAVLTLAGGHIEDTIPAATPGVAATLGPHNIAFVQHGNQGLTYSTVLRGERGENSSYDGDPNNPDDGFDDILAAHDYYDLPGCFHLAATLQVAAAWHDPSFNSWMATGVQQGWVDLVTSAWAQHMMPFIRDDMNSWSVDIERDMTNWRYSDDGNGANDAQVAWVPERVWLDNPDSDGNGVEAGGSVIDWIGDDFLDNGVQAVVLDDYIHCGYKNNVFDDHHIYTIGTGLKIVPIDNNFVGEVNWDWGSAWNRIIGSSADELIVYGNDWEIAAEVSQGASNPNGLNNYIKILQLAAANSGIVSTWRLRDAIGGFGGGSIVLQNGTYGLLGGHGGYGGGNNSWYADWAAYTGADNLDGHAPKWNYGQIWNNAITRLLAAPNNDLSQSAWYVLMTNLHETGWHDGGLISGWQHHYSNHIKNANVFSEGSRWVAGLYANPTGAYLADVDDDGIQEAVIYNDRVFAVFETIGGRAQWIFAKGPGYDFSVGSNDHVYWADTNGDYNEVNHTASLSDVSVRGVDREHDLYALSVVTGAGNTVELALTHANVEKRVKLTLGQPYLDVVYDVHGDRAYVKCAWTPDFIDLTWNGHAPLYRVWDAESGKYFGQRNTNTGATAAVVAGTAGAVHNLQFAHTLAEGDEFYGDGAFEVYYYAGTTSPPDGTGHIPELKTLRDGLTDTIGPAVVSASYYPTPNRLSIRFNQAARSDNVVRTSIAVDDDGDDVADVTLDNSCTVTTTGSSTRIDITLSAAKAAALEALNTANLRLLLQAGACTDVAYNPSAAVNAAANKTITYEAATLITIDGRIDPAEWTAGRRYVNDPNDSQWTSANEIDALYIMWDASYLYLAIDGQVSGNSWILYLDTDVGGPNGQTDLTAIDTWERGATFTAAGFRPDLQWGTYQHQGPYDSSSLFRLTSPSTSQDLTSQAILAFDAQHVFGTESGSEIAIPWDVLYGLGPNRVPENTSVGFVASICWDPEPSGQLGGDVAPNNRTAVLPVVDSFAWLPVDNDGDGVPDPDPVPTDAPPPGSSLAAAPSASHLFPPAPNPFNPSTTLVYEVAGPAGRALPVALTIHDVHGRQVATLAASQLEPGRYAARWDGREASGRSVASGVYVARLAVGTQPVQQAKLVVLK
jgi:hypothetical protein